MIRECIQEDHADVLSFIKKVNNTDFPNNVRPFRYEDIDNLFEVYSGKNDTFLILKEEDVLGIIE